MSVIHPPWRGPWQPISVFLLEEYYGQRILAGFSPRGCKESDRTEGIEHTHAARKDTTEKCI